MKLNVLLERQFKSLEYLTKQHFGNTRDTASNRVQLSDIKYIPSIEQGWIEVRSNSTTGGKQYHTILRFNEIEFVDPDEEEANEYPSFVGEDGKTYFIKPRRSVDVMVKCDCDDFRWRFATFNFADGSLAGDPPPPYVKKTKRPPVNPSQVPGICKHIFKLKKTLERDKIFDMLLN